MRSKLLAILIFISSLSFGQYVPDTETFSLQDVVDAVSPTTNNQVACFLEAIPEYYNPTYNNDLYAPISSLLRFRDYGAHNALGFETYVAPDDFDRTAQPVDIYEVFKQYYKVNHDAKWIYSVTDATTKTRPTGGTSYYYGYDSAGVAKTKNLASGDSVMWYASATKKWIITNHTSTSMMSCYVVNAVNPQNQGAEWMYCGDKISAVQTSTSSARTSPIKWIHIAELSNITQYTYCCHYGSPLAGTLHISTTPSSIAGGIAFRSCPITKVIIPDNIKTIGNENFYSCTSLTFVDFGDSISSIGSQTFMFCTQLNGTITFTSNLTSIGTSAFQSCGKLDSVIFDTGALTLGTSAFNSCPDLDVVQFAEGLTSIGDYCFNGDVQLDCPLTFPSTLTTIGYGAFLGCTGLNCTLTIPAGLTSIGEGAFGNTNFTDIDESNTNYLVYDSVLYQLSPDTLALHSVKSATDSIEFLANTELIGDYCFYNNLRTDTLALLMSMTRIGDYAFYDCNGLDGILVIPDSMITLENACFYTCDGFDGLILETGTSRLTTLVGSMFINCTGMTGNLHIPASVRTIGGHGFSYCNFDSLTFDEGVTSISTYTFGRGKFIGDLVLPNSLKVIAAYSFSEADFTGTITLGNAVTSIEDRAFSYVPFTGTLDIPSTVTSIGINPFSYNNLDSIYSAATGFTVYDYVLYDEKTSGLIKANMSANAHSGTLTLKSGITEIKSDCFAGNVNRTGTLTIPHTVTSIGSSGFSGCTGFTGTASIGDCTDGSALTTIGDYGLAGLANVTAYNIYTPAAPTCGAAYAAFGSYARPLNVQTDATGYNVTPATNIAPWTNTAIFSSVNYTLCP